MKIRLHLDRESDWVDFIIAFKYPGKTTSRELEVIFSSILSSYSILKSYSKLTSPSNIITPPPPFRNQRRRLKNIS